MTYSVSTNSVAQPVVLVDATGEPYSSSSGSQAAVTTTTETLAAGTPKTILAASASTTGARILNWTASPVYVTSGTTGTPASGAPSDYIPAAASGVPGQWEPPYRPVDGLRAVGASAGDLTVVRF